MKTFILITLAVAGIAIGAQAQGFVRGPEPQSALLSSSLPFAVHHAETNLPTASKPWCAIGADGWAFSASVGGTNANLTTNIIVRFEFSADGVNAINRGVLASGWAATFQPFGVTNATWATNFSRDVFANVKAVRIGSIQNTNQQGSGSLAGSVWFTNATVLAR